jgi:hypothetical protein
MEFALPYFVRHGGNGSAIVEFTPTLVDEGWGASSAGTVKLKVEGDKLFYRDFQQNDHGNYEYVWIEVKE